jgi:hypothetical protein
MTAPHIVKNGNYDLRVWGLIVDAPGLKCEQCSAVVSLDLLRELAERRAVENIGTRDVHCCTFPPSTVRGSSNIYALIRQCYSAAAGTPPPPKNIYMLGHRGEVFRMHGITSVVGNSALACTTCRREYPLGKIIAELDGYIDTHCPCRDFTCCQKVEFTFTGVAELGKTPLRDAQPSEPKPVCRWCKGRRVLTFNFKTKPCECVEQEK